MSLDRPQTQAAALWARLGFVPGQTLRLFGMRRSGNHAIADWLQRNAPSGRSAFLNNCKPVTDPFNSFRSIDVNGSSAPQRKAAADLASVAGKAGDGALLLFSYEDSTPAEFSTDRKMSGPFDETLISANLIAYRSFLNWSASLLKKMQGNSNFGLLRRNAILLRAIDTYTRLLGLVEQASDLHLTCICYDRWVADQAYREALLTELQLPVRDNGLGQVQRYGGGSSFQQDVAAPEQLQTTNRWPQMADDPEFQAVLHLAARDTTLMRRLARFFPEDKTRLTQIAQQRPLAPEVLA